MTTAKSRARSWRALGAGDANHENTESSDGLFSLDLVVER